MIGYVSEHACNEMSGKLLFGWLQVDDPTSEVGFTRIDVLEAVSFDATISDLVGKALIDARVSPAVSQALSKRLTKAKYRDLLADLADPQRDQTRKGDFGEILAASLLEQHLDYVVPVKKLRYAKVLPGDLPHGIDVIGFKLEGHTLAEVCYVESKLRTGRDVSFGVQAHDQLKIAWEVADAQYHHFFIEHLQLLDGSLFEEFLDFLQGRSSCRATFCLSLHADSDAWSDTTLKNLSTHPPTLSPLVVILYRMKSLSESIEKCFGALGLVASDEDD